MRVVSVAAGLALLACLLPVGMQPLAAGPGALSQKIGVAVLTCRDLDADGRPTLPLFWLDGYVSAQMNLHTMRPWACGAPNILSRNRLLFYPHSAAARRT